MHAVLQNHDIAAAVLEHRKLVLTPKTRSTYQ